CSGMEEATGAPSSFAVWDPKRLRASGRDGETVMTEPPSPLRMLLSRHTKRREFITLVGGAAATWPLAASAQQPAKQPLIGMLVPGTRATHGQWFAALVDRLRELGWIEGRTVAFEYRFAEGRTDRAAEIVAEFVRMKVDLIATSAADVTLAAKQVTSAIPIVT